MKRKTITDVRTIICTKERNGVTYVQKGDLSCWKATDTEYIKISKAKFAAL